MSQHVYDIVQSRVQVVDTSTVMQVSKDIIAAETQLLELQEVISRNKGIDSFLENYR